MINRTWAVVVAAGIAGMAIVAAMQGVWRPGPAAAQGTRPQRVVPVEVAKAARETVPVRLTAIGTVTPIASVALKSRVETTVVSVHFQDGATVKQGDLLFTLDSRQLQAQLRQAEAALAKDQAQLAGAERDVRRYTELFEKKAGTGVNLDNAKTQVDVLHATVAADQSIIENLKIQIGYCTIRAPISGQASMANVKSGSFVRPADTVPLATIVQMAPVYVSFTLPQKQLPDLRHALGAETATIEATVPGEARRTSGVVTMIDNTVDATTGMVTVRATMPNQDGLLWPGTLVSTDLTLRQEQAVTVPSTAVQVSQTGNFVFLVQDGAAKVQPVKVERVVGDKSIIASGLKGGETVVTEGQLLLSNGTKVAPRGARGPGGERPQRGSKARS